MPPGSENTTAFFGNLRQQWRGLAPGQRTLLGVAFGVVVAGLALWAGLAARGPAMAPLYTDLDPADGSAIIAQLEQQKVPYRLADNGQTILIPNSDVDQMRLTLAGQGLPNHGTVGLNSVLNLPFGATDFTRQVAYQNGIQGELEQTIDNIQGVRDSRVQIVLPQSSTFSGPGNPAQAAVLVLMQPGASLTSAQVGGIVHFVASSVQGLDPDAVTVIDGNGQVLWSQGAPGAGVADANTADAAGASGVAQSDLAVQTQTEQVLQQRLQGLLTQVFGAGNVVATVHAQLNFDNGTVDRTIFEPQGSGPAVVSSMQELQSSVNSGGGASGTTPGTVANSIPTVTGASSPSSSTSSSSDQITQNYDVSQENDHTVLAPGTISRLSVAVVVNGTLTAAQQALVTQTVEAAVGADPTRADNVTVVGMPFNQSLLNSLTSSSSALPTRAPVAVSRRDLALAVVAAVLLLALILSLAFRRRSPVDDGYNGGDGEAALGPPVASDMWVDSSEPRVDPLIEALTAAHAERERINSALRQRPADVARVIRVWLSQE